MFQPSVAIGRPKCRTRLLKANDQPTDPTTLCELHFSARPLQPFRAPLSTPMAISTSAPSLRTPVSFEEGFVPLSHRYATLVDGVERAKGEKHLLTWFTRLHKTSLLPHVVCALTSMGAS